MVIMTVLIKVFDIDYQWSFCITCFLYYYAIPQGTQEEWQRVFYICGAVYAFGAVFYCTFAQGDEQPWAGGRMVSEDIKVVCDDTGLNSKVSPIKVDPDSQDTPLKDV